MISFKEFREKTEGKVIDVPWHISKPGDLAGQCVSLIQIGNNEMYGVPLQRRGNAKDYGNNLIKNKLGYAVTNPRYGDIIVYGSNTGGGYGHVAYYIDKTLMYDQNNPSKKPTMSAQVRKQLNIRPIQYIRMYKELKPDGKEKLKATGSFLFENDTPIKVRNGKVGLAGKDTGARYTYGQKLNYYDGVYEKDGYTWLTYISATGVRRSVAVGKGNDLWGRNV